MFGWFKKKQPVAVVLPPATPAPSPAPNVAVAVEAAPPLATLPVAPLPVPPAPIPVLAAAPVIAAPIPLAAAVDPTPTAGRPALMIGAIRSRRVEVVAEQAGGRRILARVPGSQQTYGFTRDANGNYFLGSALDRSAVQLILDVPTSLKAA